ncbi:MAG: Y-family DNA polymerase [Devosia sp.]
MGSFQHKTQTAIRLSGQQRRHLALSLPLWATDCLKRADPALASGRPLALWERQKGAMRLVAVDAAAADKGLAPGQNLSDARALVPELEVREADRSAIAHIFSEFADWHSNASPIVAVLDDVAEYGDLVLDITGVAHLFGGEKPMLVELITRLRRLGYTVSGAIADTVGAAWALSHFRPGIVAADGQREAIADLPVVALRLSETQVAGLNQMGLKTIGQLYGRPRKALQARFGASLLLRLDQALGEIEEKVTPRIPAVEHFAEHRFAEPIGLLDDVLMMARDLAVRLALRLEAEHLGAQTFHLFLYRVDHKVITLTINAARATRDANHIAQLFVHRSERLVAEYDAGFGIDMIRLAASSISVVESTQVGAFETDDGAADLERLYDRISNRLGPAALVRSKLVNTHIPEQAVKLEPVVARTPDDPLAVPDKDLVRPLRLLPTPEPIEVLAEVPHGPPMRMIWRRISYRVLKSSLSEPIDAIWWHSGQSLVEALPSLSQEKRGDPRDDQKAEKKALLPPKPVHVSKLTPYEPAKTVRNYYIIEDDGGRRFWVFRLGLYGTGEMPRWYMHGFFS